MKPSTAIIFSIVLLLILATFNVNAEVTLNSPSEILGTWKQEYSAPRIDDEKRPSKEIWEFRSDGTLTTTAYDERLPGGSFSISVKFEVKDGKILANEPGRSRKNTYVVVEMEGDSMILHGGMDAFLFFKKQ